MACAWGSKVNGVLTIVAIGAAVLVDLWDLLDIRRNPSMVGVCSLVRMSHSQILLGTLLAPLCCTCIWVDRGTHHCLPCIFLGPFRRSYPFGHWR
jgi:dolichyl-phosphate-mannose--protein O-mannosyl transferase